MSSDSGDQLVAALLAENSEEALQLWESLLTSLDSYLQKSSYKNEYDVYMNGRNAYERNPTNKDMYLLRFKMLLNQFGTDPSITPVILEQIYKSEELRDLIHKHATTATKDALAAYGYYLNHKGEINASNASNARVAAIARKIANGPSRTNMKIYRTALSGQLKKTVKARGNEGRNRRSNVNLNNNFNFINSDPLFPQKMPTGKRIEVPAGARVDPLKNRIEPRVIENYFASPAPNTSSVLRSKIQKIISNMTSDIGSDEDILLQKTGDNTYAMISDKFGSGDLTITNNTYSLTRPDSSVMTLRGGSRKNRSHSRSKDRIRKTHRKNRNTRH